jgi:hypothetical protein
LNSLPAPVFGGGKWTWSAPATRTTPSASLSFDISPPVQIDGGAPIVIPLGQDKTITWNGRDFDAGAALQLSLNPLNPLSLAVPGFGSFLLGDFAAVSFSSNFNSAGVTCFASAQAGNLTIPANMLAQFSSGGVGALSVSVTESGAMLPFTNVQAAGALILVNQSSTDTRPVDFK